MTAMQLATVDQMAGGGRVIGGLGLSGPQIVEGWYGTPWGKPKDRLRDYVTIINKIYAREGYLAHDGPEIRLPYDGPGSSGLGKPLKSMLHFPQKPAIWLGTGAPAMVKMTAEIADGWLAFGMRRGNVDTFKAWFEEGFARAGNGKGYDDFEIQGASRSRSPTISRGRFRPTSPSSRSTSAAWATRPSTSTTSACTARAGARRIGSSNSSRRGSARRRSRPCRRVHRRRRADRRRRSDQEALARPLGRHALYGGHRPERTGRGLRADGRSHGRARPGGLIASRRSHAVRSRRLASRNDLAARLLDVALRQEEAPVSVPAAWPSVSIQFGTPGSSWATTKQASLAVRGHLLSVQRARAVAIVRGLLEAVPEHHVRVDALGPASLDDERVFRAEDDEPGAVRVVDRPGASALARDPFHRLRQGVRDEGEPLGLLARVGIHRARESLAVDEVPGGGELSASPSKPRGRGSPARRDTRSPARPASTSPPCRKSRPPSSGARSRSSACRLPCEGRPGRGGAGPRSRRSRPPRPRTPCG